MLHTCTLLKPVHVLYVLFHEGWTLTTETGKRNAIKKEKSRKAINVTLPNPQSNLIEILHLCQANTTSSRSIPISYPLGLDDGYCTFRSKCKQATKELCKDFILVLWKCKKQMFQNTCTHTCQHLDIQNLDTQWPGVQGQSPWRGSRAFCNFKGQGNTIFILKINVLKVQTGSVAISPLFGDFWPFWKL